MHEYAYVAVAPAVPLAVSVLAVAPPVTVQVPPIEASSWSVTDWTVTDCQVFGFVTVMTPVTLHAESVYPSGDTVTVYGTVTVDASVGP